MFAEAVTSQLVSFLLATIILAFGVSLFVFWIWMLASAIQNRGLDDGEKICWVLAIIFLPFIGSPLYFFIGRPKRW